VCWPIAATGVVQVTEGGKRLAKVGHHLDAAGLSVPEWQQNWDCARYRIQADGSADEPLGNLTITVTAGGRVSVRLPTPLQYLANAERGRYVLAATAVFGYRGDEWNARITGGQSVSYPITRTPGRAGRYLSASWATPATCVSTPEPAHGEALAQTAVLGIDLNADHLALRRLDEHGNPVGVQQPR